jgi:hypothetical protein
MNHEAICPVCKKKLGEHSKLQDKYYMSEETLRKVHNALSDEPQTPNEIADKINLNQKTVERIARASKYKEKHKVEEGRKIQIALES